MVQDLPPGFRFHPTDEELIVYYLRNQYTSNSCPSSIIPEVDIYKSDPWDLPEKAEFGEKDRYFFSPRDRKYPNGVRPNRATVSGYWKATGTDKAIYSGSKHIGLKKALVFYKGKPPKGVKTDWIMHEYRLVESRTTISQANKHVGSMRLDDWVLCRIYKKKNMGKTMIMDEEKHEFAISTANNGNETVVTGNNYHQNEQEMMKLLLPTRTFNDYLGSSVSSQIFTEGGRYNNDSIIFDLQNQNQTSSFVKPSIFPDHNNYYYEQDYFQEMKPINSSINNNQSLFVNQVFDLSTYIKMDR